MSCEKSFFALVDIDLLRRLVSLEKRKPDLEMAERAYEVHRNEKLNLFLKRQRKSLNALVSYMKNGSAPFRHLNVLTCRHPG